MPRGTKFCPQLAAQERTVKREGRYVYTCLRSARSALPLRLLVSEQGALEVAASAPKTHFGDALSLFVVRCLGVRAFRCAACASLGYRASLADTWTRSIDIAPDWSVPGEIQAPIPGNILSVGWRVAGLWSRCVASLVVASDEHGSRDRRPPRALARASFSVARLVCCTALASREPHARGRSYFDPWPVCVCGSPAARRCRSRPRLAVVSPQRCVRASLHVLRASSG